MYVFRMSTGSAEWCDTGIRQAGYKIQYIFKKVGLRQEKWRLQRGYTKTAVACLQGRYKVALRSCEILVCRNPQFSTNQTPGCHRWVEGLRNCRRGSRAGYLHRSAE